jgi:hypothetical protein
MPPPSSNPSSSKGQNIQKWSISKEMWLKHGFSSKQMSGPLNFDYWGHHTVTCPIVVPNFISSPMPLQPGYQEVHTRYDEMQRFFAQKAFTVHNGEVVVIKVTMMSLKPSNKNLSIISVCKTQVTKWVIVSNSIHMQNISETISNIPVHIGIQELKNIAYLTLLSPFIKWSKNDFLNTSDLHLCFKDWVELIPLESSNEDINAILSKFFLSKAKLKTIQFHPNKVLELYLELIFDRYAEVLNWLEEMEEELVTQVCLVFLKVYCFLKPHLDPNAGSSLQDETILYHRNGGQQ